MKSALNPINWLLFRPPPATYSESSFPGELCWIPESSSVTHLPPPPSLIDLDIIPESKESDSPPLEKWLIRELSEHSRKHIPCLLLQSAKSKGNLLLIYCHGNEEDLGTIYTKLSALANALPEIAILAVEYPGYGIFSISGKPSEDQINETVESVYFFVRQRLEWKAEQIVLVGRSLGSGPALRITTMFGAGGLILISAYTSINDVASKFIGDAASWLDKKFANSDLIKKLTCPVLFIHGEKDALIPSDHSLTLFKRCTRVKEEDKDVHLSVDMTHNSFDVHEDFIKPISRIVQKVIRSLQFQHALKFGFADELLVLSPRSSSKRVALESFLLPPSLFRSPKVRASRSSSSFWS